MPFFTYFSIGCVIFGALILIARWIFKGEFTKFDP